MSNANSISLRTNADLVAAVPTLIGFSPVESLVIVGLLSGGKRVGPVMRVSLPETPEGLAAWGVMVLRSVPTHVGLSGVAVVTLSGREIGNTWTVLRAVFRVLDIPITAAVHAESTDPGAAWMCMCGEDGCWSAGVLPGGVPEVAVHATVAGQVRYATRDEWVSAGRPGGWDGGAPPEGSE